MDRNNDEGINYMDTPERRGPGRPRSQRISYLDNHPKSEVIQRVLRSRNHNNLPNIIGPWFPRRDDPKIYPFYCASMLMLLKPWRDLKKDLKSTSQSWEEAFHDFVKNSPDKIRNVLSNIQYLHDCEEAAKAKRDDADIPVDHADGGYFGGLAGGDGDFDLEEDVTNHVHEITEDDINTLRESQTSWREELHGRQAVEIAKQAHIFPNDQSMWSVTGRPMANAMGDDLRRLEEWKAQMKKDVIKQNTSEQETLGITANAHSDGAARVTMATDTTNTSPSQAVQESDTNIFGPEAPLMPVDVSNLDAEQFQAYDIIRQHLEQTLAGNSPPQLRMVMYGAGGTGKSRIIQTVTKLFEQRDVSRLLLKAAYTGIAASLVKGKTTHHIGQISFRELQLMSDETRKKLERIWQHATYLIIDEFSMISKTFLARLSRAVAFGVRGSNPTNDQSFGGINVILCGDLHQFPPVATALSEALFYPIGLFDSTESKLGRMIYEEFSTVVILKEQHRIEDVGWKELLERLRQGDIRDEDIALLRSRVISQRNGPTINFNSPPWNDASLVTPRHGVRNVWNEAASRKWCQLSGERLYICDADDTIKGRHLTMAEKYALFSRNKGSNRRKRNVLPSRIHLARGMKVMVTNNIETDLDVANGARGEIVDIILHPEEPPVADEPIVRLQRMPAYILVKLTRTRASRLEGLGEAVIPVEPMVNKIQIKVKTAEGKTITRTVSRRQYPMTAAYAFTDYRSQGQTIPYLIVDIANPPSGRLSLFNLYVALSRGVGRSNVCILRDFDEEVFRKGHLPELAMEDNRLQKLDVDTRKRWVENR
jgi:PIF1-like helicase